MRYVVHRPALCATILAFVVGNAIVLNVSDDNSIKRAASTIAHGAMSYYEGNRSGNEPGLLPAPYYWWEAGAMWGTMVEYWHYTGDATYNVVVSEAILAQASPTKDFMMTEEAGQTGNDDQAFWAITAMTAAERGFPSPASDQSVWLELAVNVFNDMVPRWNTSTCNGGFQWQFNPSNAGFYQKTSISNGGFFQLAARLARHTGNTTYSDWAERTYNWMARIGLIGSNYRVYDSSDDTINCTQIDQNQWTYNVGVFLLGSAALANISTSNNSSPWTARTKGLLNAVKAVFVYPNANSTNILYESKCEEASKCNTDQFSFKAYLSRWMVETAQMQPSLEPEIMPIIMGSAQGAAAACAGNGDSTFGTKWYIGGWDGTQGLGQQLSALETVQGLLVNSAQPAPFLSDR